MKNTRSKVIRKVPLITKIRHYPYDLLLSLNEWFQLVDWDQLANDYSFYILAILNLMLLLSKLYIDNFSIPKYKTLKVKTPKDATLVFVTVIYHVLNLISLINFFLCVTSIKNYDLITRDINQVPNTPSLFKIEIDKPVEESQDSGYLVVRLIKYICIKLYHRLFPKESVKKLDKCLTWRLIVWTPSLVQLHLLALFSPLNIIFVFLITPIGFSSLLFLLLLSIFQYFIIIFKYETKLKDEFIIQQHFLQEYNTKFVNPRLNKIYVDKSVDGWNNGTVRLFHPDKRTRQFITHSF